MSPDRRPQRGEVWWVAFEPSLGGEIRKTRPAVVVRNDLANRERVDRLSRDDLAAVERAICVQLDL